MSLSGVNRLTLREQVWMNLRSAILEGRLPAGTRLGEIDLANQLDVSRGTVREALRLLQQSGLVEGQDRSGLHVADLDARDVTDLFEVRTSLETLAAQLIVASGKAQEVADDLEKFLPNVEPGVPVTERLDADLAFHEALCVASENEMLLKMWRELQDLFRVAVLAHNRGENLELMNSDYHRPIIECLRSEDAEKVRTTIAEHMRHSASVWAAKSMPRI